MGVKVEMKELAS